MCIRDSFGVAAVLFDPLFSTEGLVKVPAGYIDGLIQRVRAAGGLYIADEVQSGFGRVGRLMWGHELFEAVPDIVTMGKPMGNGHPLGATVMNSELLEAFGAENMFFNTFAGNPVSSAAGHAVLKVMEDEQLMPRAAENGALLKLELSAAVAGNARIDEVRGCLLYTSTRRKRPRPGRGPARCAAHHLRGAAFASEKLAQALAKLAFKLGSEPHHERNDLGNEKRRGIGLGPSRRPPEIGVAARHKKEVKQAMLCLCLLYTSRCV